MPDSTQIKLRLRSELRARRRALTEQAQAAAAMATAQRITALPQWPHARRIAVYLAADGELDTGPLTDFARRQGKQLFLPVIQPDNSLHFARWHSEDSLTINNLGIPEPGPDARRSPARELDIIFLPLVGFDRQGSRLGMGGGFYDRSLEGINGPLLVGLAHSCQEAENIPQEDWDIPLDYIATDGALHNGRGTDPAD